MADELDRVVLVAYAVNQAGWEAMDNLTDNSDEYIFDSDEGENYQMMAGHTESRIKGESLEHTAARALSEANLA